MAQLGYWDAEYLELLRYLLNEQPQDGKLYKLFVDFLPSVNAAVFPSIPELKEISVDDYDKKDEAWKDSIWISISGGLSNLKLLCLEHQGMEYLSHRFDLNDHQRRIIVFLFLFDRFSAFTSYCLGLSEQKMIMFLERYFGVHKNRIIEDLRPSGFLNLCGIISDICVPQLSINRFNLKVSLSQYISYFLDDTHDRSLASFVLESPSPDYYAVETFDLPNL